MAALLPDRRFLLAADALIVMLSHCVVACNAAASLDFDHSFAYSPPSSALSRL